MEKSEIDHGYGNKSELPWKKSPPTSEMRAELAERGLEPLTDDELTELSATFNKLLEVVEPGASTWLPLFKKMDDDDSGVIKFDELLDLVTHELKFSVADLPEEKVRQLWCSLDSDDSNTVKRDEFGRFMMLAGSDSAAHTHAHHAEAVAEEQRQAKLAKMAEEEAEAAKRAGANNTKTAALREALKEEGLAPLDVTELLALSKTFNEAMVEHFGEGKRWLVLFTAADDDGSGNILYDELLDVIRVELKQTKEDLPESKVKQLWCALDRDDSNTVGRVEFSMFMALGAPERTTTGANERRAEAVRQDTMKKQAMAEAAEAKMAGANNTKTAELREELTQKGLLPLDEDEVKSLSAKFTATLERLSPNGSKSWISLFKQMDDDQSGLITYDELIDLVRVELQQTKADLPDVTVKRLWCALDKDDSNTVAQDEFGAFMNLSRTRTTVGAAERRAAELKKANTAKVLLQQEKEKANRAKGEKSTVEIREELAAIGVGPATEEEQKEMSALFNRRLEYIIPGAGRTRSWVTLFRAVDNDDSGNITYDELEIVVRKNLKLPKTATKAAEDHLSDTRLKALWLSLDADAGGQLSSAEFGRFMMSSIRAAKPSSPRSTSPKRRPLPELKNPLPARLAPGANKPQGAFKTAFRLNNFCNPPAPEKEPTYEDSPWRPKNRSKYALSPRSYRPHSPGRPISAGEDAAELTWSLQRYPSPPSARSPFGSRTGSPKRRTRPRTLFDSSFVSQLSFTSANDGGMSASDGRWPQPFVSLTELSSTPRGFSRDLSPLVGPGRPTTASKAQSIWAMADVPSPRFPVSSREVAQYSDVSMYTRIAAMYYGVE